MSCVWMLQRGHSGDGCVLVSTLCKYDLRKGDLFGVRWGSISSKLLVCGGGVRSILLLPLVARCLETIDVCIWRMFVFMSVVVTVWGSVGMFVVFSVCIVRRGAVGARVWGVSVSSCRCCMLVSCVHPVAVLNAVFCMTCRLLMLVEDAIGDHTEEAYSRAGLITAL